MSVWYVCCLCLCRYMKEKELYESCMVKLERHSRKSRWSSCFPACCTGSAVFNFSPRQSRLRRQSGGSAADIANCDWLSAPCSHQTYVLITDSTLLAEVVYVWRCRFCCDKTAFHMHSSYCKFSCHNTALHRFNLQPCDRRTFFSCNSCNSAGRSCKCLDCNETQFHVHGGYCELHASDSGIW